MVSRFIRKELGKDFNFFKNFKYGGIISSGELKSTGEPETFVDYYVGGRVKKRRFYGEDGKAVLDIHTNGHGNIYNHPYSYNGLHVHDEPIYINKKRGNPGDLSQAEYYFNKDIYNDQR